MIRAVLIAAVAGFSWPYFVDVSIPGIPPRHTIPPVTEIGLSALSKSDDTTSANQVVNRSLKGDKLNVHRTSDVIVSPANNAAQTTRTPNALVKITFEQFDQAARMANDCVVDLYNRVNVDAKVVAPPVQLASTLNPANSAWRHRSQVWLNTIATSRLLY